MKANCAFAQIGSKMQLDIGNEPTVSLTHAIVKATSDMNYCLSISGQVNTMATP